MVVRALHFTEASLLNTFEYDQLVPIFAPIWAPYLYIGLFVHFFLCLTIDITVLTYDDDRGRDASDNIYKGQVKIHLIVHFESR